MKRQKRTCGEVRTGHIITYGARKLKVTCVVPYGDGVVEISGQTIEVRPVGRTFRAGMLREIVIHNWLD